MKDNRYFGGSRESALSECDKILQNRTDRTTTAMNLCWIVSGLSLTVSAIGFAGGYINRHPEVIDQIGGYLGKLF